MRIHAIQTGAVAVKVRQREGSGPGPLRLVNTLRDDRWTEPLPILAWVIEHPEGLVVVDTGETARTAEKGYFPAWHPYFRLGVREWVAADEEIGPQLQRLGLSAADVRWPHWFSPTPVDLDDGAFGPIRGARPLTAAGDVTLLATPGHTSGHMSVAVDLHDRLVLLAGDASYTQDLMLGGIADGVTNDARTARSTLAALRALVDSRPTIYLPSHDPGSPGRLSRLREPASGAGESAGTPAASRRS